MRHSPNEKLAILERRKHVAARYVRGETQWEIARAFEVDQKTVSNDLKAIREEWLAAAVLDMDEVKAAQLAKVDATEAEAWKAWTKSQEKVETLRARMRGRGDDATSETEKITKGQAGDPRFLDVVLKCVQRRCEIFGLVDSLVEKRLNKMQETLDLLRSHDQRGNEAKAGDAGDGDSCAPDGTDSPPPGP